MCSVVDIASVIVGQNSAREQQKAQEKAYAHNAMVANRQAELAREEGQRQVEKERLAFAEASGRNQSVLASANVDTSSGSALDLLVSNRSKASARIADAEYEAELAAWEYESNSVQQMNKITTSQERQASYDALFIVKNANKAYSLFS